MAVRRDALAGLTLEVLDFLLKCDRSTASVDRVRARGVEYSRFARFELDLMPAEDFQVLWRSHEAAVRREARRRGLEMPDPSTYQPHPFGSWVTRQWDGD